MKNLSFPDTAALILILTIVSICGSFYYEIGACTFLGIPREFITIELNKYSFLLFAVLSGAFFIGSIIDPIIGHFLEIRKIKYSIVRILLYIALLAVLVLIFSEYLKFLRYQDTLVLLIVLIFGIILILNSDRKDSDYNLIKPKYSLNLILAGKFGTLLGPAAIILSLICSTTFCLGYRNAQAKSIFFTRPDNKTFLLKKYGNTKIFGVYEQQTFTRIIVEEGYSLPDTLSQIKIK